jgi:hypothetical protein
VKNIVFEFHEIPGFQQKLEAVKERLSLEGFLLKTRDSLITARREANSSEVDRVY